MIQAITFDLDGVYFPDGKTAFIKALQEHGVTEEEATRVFLKSDEMNFQYKLGKMTDEEFWGWAAKEWKLNLSPKELIDLLISSYRVDPQVEGMVKIIRKNGYKTLICSNNFKARVNGLQERFKLLDNFDAAVFSYEVGAAKPSKLIFDKLVEKAGVPADSIIFADDDAGKLTGARTAGINTFLFKDFDQFTRELKKLGVKL